MHFKSYRESQGSPASCEIIIICDERDRDHPYIAKRKALYEKDGKRVTVKIAKQPGDKKHDPKKDRKAPGTQARTS